MQIFRRVKFRKKSFKRLSHDVGVEGERETVREREKGVIKFTTKGNKKKLRVAAGSRWPGDFTEGKVNPFCNINRIRGSTATPVRIKLHH